MANESMNIYISEWYEKNTMKNRKLMHDLWEHPELALHEYYACQRVVEFVKEEGFTEIETFAAEDPENPNARPNTVIASWGSGHPVIGIVGELDALPGLGQDCNCNFQSPIDGPGHGCGHNLMGGGAAGAAAAIRYAMEKEGLSGTVRLIEAPAEETGVGKAYLAKKGVFSEIDMALMWHPMPGPLDMAPVAQQVAFRVQFDFHGIAKHAAGEVWNGRSALDAVQIMNIGCEFLREHKKPETWMHYCITNGGKAPNIVPDFAQVEYMFRSMDDYPVAENLFQRAVKCAEGAAHMTETTMEYRVLSCMPQFYYNIPLCRHMQQAAEKVPAIHYTDEERADVRKFYENAFHKVPTESDEELLPSGLGEFNMEKLGCMQCTDASIMTYFCPTIHCQGTGFVKDVNGHDWETTYTAGSALGEKAGIYAYQTIAQAGIEVLENPELADQFWEEYRAMNIPEYKFWL